MPNKGLQPTPTASARPSLRLLARLRPSVRGCARGKTQETGWRGRHVASCASSGAAGHGRWPGPIPSSARGVRRAPNGSQRQTRRGRKAMRTGSPCMGTHLRGRCVRGAGKRVARARQARRRVGHPSGRTLRAPAGGGVWPVPSVPLWQGIRRCRWGRWPWWRPSAGHAMPSYSPRGCHRMVSQARWLPGGVWRLCHEAPWSRRAWRGAWGRPAPWGRSGAGGGRRHVAVRPRAQPGGPGVGLLPGREAYNNRVTGGLAPPEPPAWVGAHSAQLLSLCTNPGQESKQTGAHPEGGVSCPCGP
jgi:hypothetical protein